MARPPPAARHPPISAVLTAPHHLPQSIRAALMPRLGSVVEGDEPAAEKPLEKPLETPVEETAAQPARAVDAVMSSPKPSTPAKATPVKLPMSEMHPSKTHQTMAAPSSGLKLGFIDINTDRKGGDRPTGAGQTTPSKTPVAPSPFTFRVPQPGQNLGLSPEARKIQDALREDAARIRAERAAARERGELMDEDADARKIAKPKGKANRFSDVHIKEFKKMDSIMNHWSVTSGRQTPKQATPLKQGLKRTQSKANLDEAESSTSRKVNSARSSVKSKARPAPEQVPEEPESPAKRVRQRLEDDASSSRPVSRDGSQIPRPRDGGNSSVRPGIPRPKGLAHLMTPTKASVAKTHVTKTPTVSLVKSPSKPDLGGLARSTSRPELGASLLKSPARPEMSNLFKSPSRPTIGSNLTKSATVGSLTAPKAAPSVVQTPGRFDRVKSILKKQFSTTKPKSSIPQFSGAAPKTPGRTEKESAPVPMTTPAHKFGKHVEFTPDTKQATLSQNSPSPVKSNIPRSATTPKISAPHFMSMGEMLSGSKNSGKKDKGEKKDEGQISYPDLSAYEAELAAAPENEVQNDKPDKPEELPESVPGTFTFRSDHTIQFDGASPKGFGGSAGQASLRHVRPSSGPNARMPGSFPGGSESAPNKENKDPAIFTGIPHGMSAKKRARAVWEDDEVKTGISHGLSNKKRHRASSDEEEEVDEGTQRAAKKLRKNPPVAQGQALLAPTLSVTSPSPRKLGGMSRTPSPQKKRTGISLSRLNMLARPKARN